MANKSKMIAKNKKATGKLKVNISDGNQRIERFLVVLSKDNSKESIARIENISGVSIRANSNDYGTDQKKIDDLSEDDGIVLNNLTIASINATEEQYNILKQETENRNGIISIAKDRKIYAANKSFYEAYYHGYRDAIELFVNYYDLNKNSNAKQVNKAILKNSCPMKTMMNLRGDFVRPTCINLIMQAME